MADGHRFKAAIAESHRDVDIVSVDPDLLQLTEEGGEAPWLFRVPFHGEVYDFLGCIVTRKLVHRSQTVAYSLIISELPQHWIAQN